MPSGRPRRLHCFAEKRKPFEYLVLFRPDKGDLRGQHAFLPIYAYKVVAAVTETRRECDEAFAVFREWDLRPRLAPHRVLDSIECVVRLDSEVHERVIGVLRKRFQ